MGTVNELLTNLNGAITTGKTNLANKGIDTTNIHTVYGVIKAIPDIETAGEATLVAISVTPPTTTTYTQGDALDTTGMTVKGIYSDGTTPDITSSVTPPTATLSTVGTQTITVTHTVDGTDFTDTFEVFVNAKDGLNWVNDRIVITAADANSMTAKTINSKSYLKISDNDALLAPETDYVYCLGYSDLKSQSAQDGPSGFVTLPMFWKSPMYKNTISSNAAYTPLGEYGYIVYKDNTTIGGQTLSKGTWIALNTSTEIPFTILRITASDTFSILNIDPATTYVAANQITLTETGYPYAGNPNPFTGYKISDRFLPYLVSSYYIKSDNTTQKLSKLDGSHYDITSNGFGCYAQYEDNNRLSPNNSHPCVISVSADNTSVQVSSTSNNLLTLPEKGTYIFCKDDTSAINNFIGIGCCLDPDYHWDSIALISQEMQFYNVQSEAAVLKYDYYGIPEESITLQNNTVLNSPKAGAAIYPITYIQNSSYNIELYGAGLNVAETSANCLVKGTQIGPFSYYYTCTLADDTTVPILAEINDFYLFDGTFVRNPGVYTALNDLHIKVVIPT